MSSLVVLVTVVVLCPLSSDASSLQDLLRLEREEAASRWAPLVWLHPTEDFFPSSVPHFLQHITLSTEAGRRQMATARQGAGTEEVTLPGGKPSRDLFLTAQHDFNCLDCSLPVFLRGEKPRKRYSPPVYVTVHVCSLEASGRTTRSTRHPLRGEELANDRMNVEEAARYSIPTTSPYTGHASTPSFTSPSLPPTTSPPTSNQNDTLPDTFFPSNHSQTGQTPSFSSTPEPTHSPSSAYDGNDTSTSPPICSHNSSLCHSNHSDGTALDTNENVDTIEQEMNIFPDDTEIQEGTTTKNTEPPEADEYWTVTNNTTAFQWTPEISTEVNDTGDSNNTSTRDQPHSNERRHARQLTHYGQVYTLTYWMFYPYNRGKNVCTVNLGAFLGHMFKPRMQGQCHGEEITMGNHVGDWEHVSIEFKSSRPRRMYVSTHTFGAYYTYDPHSHAFIYESEDTRKGLPMSPAYPRTIQLTGSHPILYSAKGSHGLWGAEGVHEYNSFPQLVDETGRGVPWRTWTNLQLVDIEVSESLEPHRNWWRYEGRWGNPSSSCHLLLGGFCEHVKGPTGIPRKRINFPCNRL